MANMFSCFFVCKNTSGQITANSSGDDADSDNIKRRRSKPSSAPTHVPQRNSTGSSAHKNSKDKLGQGKGGGDDKLQGGHHRKSNSVSTYPAGGGKKSSRNPPVPTKSSTVMEEESFVGTPMDWMNRGGERKSASRDLEEGSFVAGNEWKNGIGARKSANGRIEEVEESFVADEDWNYRGEGGGKNEKKKRQPHVKSVKKSPPRMGVELKSFVADGSPRRGGGFEASSFGRSWEKSQNSVSLSEWATVFKPNFDNK